MRDENWLMPDKIIDSGYHEYQDPDTGMIFTEHDLANFAIMAREQGIDPNLFRTVPFPYVSEQQRSEIWEKIIRPHMADPNRITMQDLIEQNHVRAKQRYLEAITYIPEANRIKDKS